MDRKIKYNKKAADDALKLKTGEELITGDEDTASNFSNVALKLEQKFPNVISSSFFHVTANNFIANSTDTNLLMMKLEINFMFFYY